MVAKRAQGPLRLLCRSGQFVRVWELPAGSSQTLVPQSLSQEPQKADHLEQNEPPRPPVAAAAQSPADHSSLSGFRQRLPEEVCAAAHDVVLEGLHRYGLLKGRHLG